MATTTTSAATTTPAPPPPTLRSKSNISTNGTVQIKSFRQTQRPRPHSKSTSAVLPSLALTGGKGGLDEDAEDDEPEVINFDSDGDLHLIVGGGKVSPQRFVVCSRTLARASPVFKTMLFGAFSESRPCCSRNGSSSSGSSASGRSFMTTRSGDNSSPLCGGFDEGPAPAGSIDDDAWTIELPDDDPKAFRTLMGIIHSSFNYVPDTVEVVELFQIAILTDKYDMTHLLRPWSEQWCARQRTRRHPYRLWIAWVLGDDLMFESEAKRLALGCPVNKCGQLLVRCTNGNFQPLESFDYLRLPDILESIAAVRFEAAEKILQKLSAVHRNLATANGRHCKEPSAAARQECRLDCENALLGSTIKALDANGLWPLPQAPALTYSLDTLVQKVAATAHMIRPLSSRDNNSRSSSGGGGSGIRHVECNPAVELEDYARKVLASTPSPVQHMHLAHMENQAKKSGLWFEEKEQ
ncbi:hypothetical protein MCOR25_004800 [Pyricularia grisea]|nr:hypothetical protein MCOR25_004800 [Pyricularia grisea]